ncbi:hypothetical protein ACP275_10G018800 [Erythranthe tilingii]
MAISPFTDKELFNPRSFSPISHGHRRFAEIPEAGPPLRAAPAIAGHAVEHDGLNLCRFMVFGSTAGMVEHMSMFPVDTIKTQMQALGSYPIKSDSVNQVVRSILKSDGPKGFYLGIRAMTLGAGAARAV